LAQIIHEANQRLVRFDQLFQIAERKECRRITGFVRKRKALRFGRIFDHRVGNQNIKARILCSGLDDVAFTNTRGASDQNGIVLGESYRQNLLKYFWADLHISVLEGDTETAAPKGMVVPMVE